MLGRPKYTYGDIVEFKVIMNSSDQEQVKTGYIAIIDRWGTWEYDKDVSYDILVETDGPRGTLYKHFPETAIINKVGHKEDE